jgi:hypothetical protein
VRVRSAADPAGHERSTPDRSFGRQFPLGEG